eukprot:3869230-Lingulodinium_polyedra.AAC.1
MMQADALVLRPGAATAKAATPKKRRITAGKAQEALQTLMQKEMDSEFERELKAICDRIREEPEKLMRVKAFLASGAFSSTSAPECFAKGVTKLSD